MVSFDGGDCVALHNELDGKENIGIIVSAINRDNSLDQRYIVKTFNGGDSIHSSSSLHKLSQTEFVSRMMESN